MKDCILCGADLRNCCVENLSLEDTELEDAYTQGIAEKEQDWERSCGPCMTYCLCFGSWMLLCWLL